MFDENTYLIDVIADLLNESFKLYLNHVFIGY